MKFATVIGLDDPAALRALAAVARFFDIELRQGGEGPVPSEGALILGGTLPFDSVERNGSERAILKFSPESAGEGAKESVVAIHAHAGLPTIFQRKSLFVKEPVHGSLPSTLADLQVAATVGSRAVWKIRKSTAVSLFVATSPPRLGPTQRLAEIFNGETFFAVLPVWLFLRALSSSAPDKPAPLRACMVVDDPNLHASTYGFVDYAQVIDLASTQPFHLAVATVPLDGWGSSAAAVRLFAGHPEALSLLVHGNDHLHYELSRPLSEAQREDLVRQALARVSAFEAKSHLRVDRVMAPPHGVCSPAMMKTLRRCGFEGMTTNRWSLWKDSPPATLPENFGLLPVDVLEGGLAVVPRFRFNSEIAVNEIVLAALLGQPIVPYGHHQDFSRDLAVVREVVTAINSLGPVTWSNMSAILESTFDAQVSGGLVKISMYSQKISGQLPPEVTQVEVTSRHFDHPIQLEWNFGPERGSATIRAAGEIVSVPAGATFRAYVQNMIPANPRGSFPFRSGAFVRRVLSETRDRLRV